MITQATLDLLDADLRAKATHYKDLPFDDRQKLFTHPIRIDPYRSEEKYPKIPKLKWSKKYKFSDHPNFERIITSKQIGIYVMYIRPPNLINDMPQFVMYVGISGENGSGRPLRERLMDYFQISKLKIRTNVHKMLQLYYEHVYIKYALYNGKYSNLESIEMALHEFYYPKFGKRDFEPDTAKAHSAWNTGR